MDNSRLFGFVGGESGRWAVTKMETVAGRALPTVKRLDILNGRQSSDPSASWVLYGMTSNERYVTRAEKGILLTKQAGLDRPEATCGAMIPMRKNSEWWALAQDERRAIIEDRSHHIHTGLKYLPAIARRLHHCRDLGLNGSSLEQDQPFDFITLFDYAQEHAAAFEDLLGELRSTEEWKYVDREIDVRMVCAQN